MSRYRYVLVGAVVLLFIIFAINLFSVPGPDRVYQELTYSVFLDRLEENEVHQVVMRGNHLTGILKDGTSFSTYVPRGDKTVDLLLAKKVVVDVRPSDDAPTFLSVFVAWLPLVLLFGSLWFFVSRPLARIERRLEHLEQAIPKQQKASREQDG